jgi:hypothetical protein
MKTPAILAIALLSASVASSEEPKTPRPCETVAGPITFKEKDSRRMGIRDPQGKIHTYTVDSVAMPHWYEEFQVGDKVVVACKDAGEERRPIATSIKTSPDAAPKP